MFAKAPFVSHLKGHTIHSSDRSAFACCAALSTRLRRALHPSKVTTDAILVVLSHF